MSSPGVGHSRDPGAYQPFWSTEIDDVRIVHSVKKRAGGGVRKWFVQTRYHRPGLRTEYSRSIRITEEAARVLWSLATVWTNIDEVGRPLYPPEFPGGFDDVRYEDDCPSEVSAAGSRKQTRAGRHSSVS